MKVPVDIKQFKKIKSDDKTTTLLHPKGHKFTIAHGALNEKTRKQLEGIPVHMSDGGMSKMPEEQTSQNPAPGVNINISTQPNMSPMPQQQMPQALPPKQDQAQAQPAGASSWAFPGQAIGSMLPDFNPEVFSPQNLAFPGVTKSAVGSPPSLSRPQAPIPEDPGLDDKAPDKTPTPTVQPSGIDPYGGAYDRYTKGISEQKEGLQGQADAQAQMGAEQESAIKASVDKQKAELKTYAEHHDALMRERAAFLQDYQDKHVDPNRIYKNMDTTQKIGTAIGLIMGGIGGGILHQENPALKYINQQIDRDIESQKIDIDKGHNLLAANMQQFGNLREATMMTKSMLNDITANELRQAAAKAQSPMAKAAAMQAAGKLDYDSAETIGKMSVMKTLLGGGSNISPERRIGMLPKEDQKAAREELSMVKGFQEASTSIKNDFEKMRGIGISGKIPFTASKAEAETIRAKIVSKIRASMKGQGALSDQEVEQSITPLLPYPGDTVAQLNKKELALNEILRNKISGGTPVLDQYNINPFGGAASAAPSSTPGAGKDGIDFQKRKAK